MVSGRSTKVGWVGAIEHLLGRVSTRIVLSVAIVLSLIPHDAMDVTDLWFLALFTPEFVARAIVACRKESEDGTPHPIEGVGWRWPRPLQFALLVVDLVALLSFLPWGALHSTRWLRLFRLTRTVMLLRYWAPLARDLWAVLRRRERARQLTLMAAAVVIVAFAGTVFLNHVTDEVGDDFDGDGEIGDPHDHVFWVRMWWAFRQIQDAGNLLASPHDFGTLVVSLGLMLFGLFMISFLIGIGTDAVSELMELSNLRSSGLQRHTVLINITPGTRQLLFEVIGEYRKLIPDDIRPFTLRWLRELRKNSRRRREFVVVGNGPEPPDFMREPEFSRIYYREKKDVDDEAFLDRADVPVARRVVVLADVDADEPDHETVRTLLTIVERLRQTTDHDETAKTTLIAEILDESNIGAARKAIARASGRLEAHIIPTERLLALFVACVARRQGVARLLHQLLPSSGHELYTHDYERDGDERVLPSLAGSPARVHDHIYWRGATRPPSRRVLTVGVLVREEGRTEGPPRVLLNPRESDFGPDSRERFVGFVALAPNLRVSDEFADEILRHPLEPAAALAPPEAAIPPLHPDATNPLRKVVICGFRPATVDLVEALVRTQPDAEILVLVEDEAAKAAALDAFDGQANLVRTGLLSSDLGTFGMNHAGFLEGHREGSTRTFGKIWIETGDWTSSRQLLSLPHGFGAAPQADAVILISSARSGSDGRITSALMKLEHLQDHIAARNGSRHPQTLIAELINGDLARRLENRYRALGREDIIVFSLHELRAFFMFQSVVVPRFHLVYGELMAPWGQSFARMRPAAPGRGRCTFAQLAGELHRAGHVLIGVELRGPDGEREFFLAQGDPSADDEVPLDRLESLWVIRPDDAPLAEERPSPRVGIAAPA